MDKDTVIDKTYRLLLYSIPMLEKFPRSQKFLLGDRIETYLLNLLELYIKAYYSKKPLKTELLAQANLKIETLRFLARLCHDLKLLSVKQYETFCKQLYEIGTGTGAWLKALEK